MFECCILLNRSIFTIALTSLLFSLPLASFSQAYLDDFHGIDAEGSIPTDMLLSWGDKAAEDVTASVAEDMTRWERRDIEQFWVGSHNFLDQVLKSGMVSFNDPVSNYINTVKNNLLKDDPQLRDQIRIFLYKSPSVNAFMTPDGVMFIHTGLISRLKSEAELAYVLAHEISHYTAEHAFENFKDNEEILDDKNFNSLEVFDIITKRSQDQEFEADVQGMKLFMKSDYQAKAFEGVMDFLYYDHLPFEEQAVSHTILNTHKLKLPEIFFSQELDSLEPERDVFDETHSHPNTFKRRNKLRGVKKQSLSGGVSPFIQSEETFLYVRDIARFEVVREQVLLGLCGDAIYNIHVLKEKYKNNKFLDLALVKSLYTLAAFKAKNEYTRVARSSRDVQGESQQVHYLLRQFDRKQLTTLALHHLLEAQKRYPEEKYLNKYVNALTRYMYVDCGMEPDDFTVEAASLPEFTKSLDDYRSERELLRAKQRHYGEFYKYVIQEELKSGWLKENLDKHKAYADSISNEWDMQARDKRRRDKAETKKILNEGAGLRIREMILLDPSYAVINAEDTDDYEEVREGDEALKLDIPKWASEQGIKVSPLYIESMGKTEVERYNRFSALQEWVREASKYYDYGLTPTSIDISEADHLNLSSRYLCRISGLSNEGNNRAWYVFTIYDLQKGEVIYRRGEDFRRGISLREFEKEIRADLERIYN